MPPRFLISLAAGVLLALTFPSVATAEWHFIPNIGWTFAADTNLSDPGAGTSKVHWNFGGSVALLGAGILGVEGTVVWTPGFFAGNGPVVIDKSHALTMMGNVVLTTPRKWSEYNLRPLVSGGFGFLGVSRTGDELFPDTWNTPAFNIGGGAVGFFTKRTGIRFDLRYYNSIHKGDEGCPTARTPPGCHLRYMTASVGVVIRR